MFTVEPRAGFDPATNSLQGLRIEDFRDFLTVDLRFEERTVVSHCNGVKRFFRIVKKNPL